MYLYLWCSLALMCWAIIAIVELYAEMIFFDTPTAPRRHFCCVIFRLGYFRRRRSKHWADVGIVLLCLLIKIALYQNIVTSGKVLHRLGSHFCVGCPWRRNVALWDDVKVRLRRCRILILSYNLYWVDIIYWLSAFLLPGRCSSWSIYDLLFCIFF